MVNVRANMVLNHEKSLKIFDRHLSSIQSMLINDIIGIPSICRITYEDN